MHGSLLRLFVSLDVIVPSSLSLSLVVASVVPEVSQFSCIYCVRFFDTSLLLECQPAVCAACVCSIVCILQAQQMKRILAALSVEQNSVCSSHRFKLNSLHQPNATARTIQRAQVLQSKCVWFEGPKHPGPVWNVGISKKSRRNFMRISLFSQEKRRNMIFFRNPNRP